MTGGPLDRSEEVEILRLDGEQLRRICELKRRGQ
jgi:hypothetical protein